MPCGRRCFRQACGIHPTLWLIFMIRRDLVRLTWIAWNVGLRRRRRRLICKRFFALKKTRWIIYTAIFSATILIFAVLIYQDYYPPTKPIERFFHISIPEDAIDVQAQYDWVFQGWRFYVQFKLPSPSFNDLKLKVCGDQALGTEYNQEASRPRNTAPIWWLADPTSISVSARCVIPGTLTSFDFLVDRSDANLFVIYMRGSLG